jgi:hypothetical protein
MVSVRLTTHIWRFDDFTGLSENHINIANNFARNTLLWPCQPPLVQIFHGGLQRIERNYGPDLMVY